MDITRYNKAIVALIMGIIAAAHAIWPGKIGLDEATVTIIVGALRPVLVWAIPNSKKTD